MELTAFERAEAHRGAALGLGWENICVALVIVDDKRQREIRAIVLGHPRRQSTPLYKLQEEARKRAKTLRNRQLSSTANRIAPITLPRLSILGDDQ